MSAPSTSDDWIPCQPGEIGSVVKAIKTRQRRKTLVQAAGVTSILVVLAAVLTGLLGGNLGGQPELQDIACQRVLDLAPQFVAHQLDPELRGQIEVHLMRCKHCRDEIHAQFPKFPLPNDAAAGTCRNSQSLLSTIPQ